MFRTDMAGFLPYFKNLSNSFINIFAILQNFNGIFSKYSFNIMVLCGILEVFVNANSFCIQCSVMASAALTRDRVLHYLPRQVKFYSLSFRVIDIKRLFQRNKLLYYLKAVLLPNTWASQQHKCLKHGGREPVASKKMILGQVVPNFTGQVVRTLTLQNTLQNTRVN